MTDEIFKVCKKHGDLTADSVLKRLYKDKIYYRCRHCAREYCETHRHKHHEKLRASARIRATIYYEKHKERINLERKIKRAMKKLEG